MLRKFRKGVRLAFFIVAVVFVLFIFLEWGLHITSSKKLTPKERGIIGYVNNIPIPFSLYNDYVERLTKEGFSYGSAQRNAFSLIIDEMIIEQEFRKRNIKFTDEQIFDIIKNNPPQELLKDTSFLKEDGRFDFEKYQKVISDPANKTFVISYGEMIKRELPKQVLYQMVVSGNMPHQTEIINECMKEYTKLKVAYAKIDKNISEDEIYNFYEKNKEKMKRNEKEVVKYVKFEIPITQEDTIEAEKLAKEILEIVKSDSGITEIAKKYNARIIISEEKKKEKYGITQKDGYFHIFKSDTELIIPILPSDENKANVEEEAYNFIENAKIDGFDNAAKNFNKKIKKASKMEEINLQYFDLSNEGKIFGPIECENCFYVLCSTKEKMAPIDEIKKEYFRNLAKNILNKLNKENFNEELKKYGFKVDTLSVDSIISESGEEKEILLKSTQMNKDEIGVIETDKSIYLVHLIEKITPDEEKIKKVIKNFVQYYITKRNSILYKEWLESRKKEAHITDLRYNID